MNSRHFDDAELVLAFTDSGIYVLKDRLGHYSDVEHQISLTYAQAKNRIDTWYRAPHRPWLRSNEPEMMLPPPAGFLARCDGCGFNAKAVQVVEKAEWSDRVCLACVRCSENPDLREAYRRGFNAGLDALAQAVAQTAQGSNLRRRR